VLINGWVLVSNKGHETSVPRLAVIVGTISIRHGDVMNVPNMRWIERLDTPDDITVDKLSDRSTDVGFVKIV